MYQCPICGNSSNRRGDPFETKQQVIAHVDGSHDADHEDIRGEDIRGEIAEVSTNVTGDGSEGTSSGSSETEDDSPSEQNRPSAQVSTSVRGENSDDTGYTAETESDPETDHPETVEMTPGDISEMYETAVDEGYQAGKTEAKRELQAEDSGGDDRPSPGKRQSRRSPSQASSRSGSSLVFKAGYYLLGFVVILAGVLGLISGSDQGGEYPWERA